MDKRIAHIIYIPLTGVGIYGGYKGDDWFKYRIQIFKDYTLKSLANQIDRQFLIWISMRNTERNNPLVVELENYLKSIKMNYVLSFNGLMYVDDKFVVDWFGRFKNMLRVLRMAWRIKSLKGCVSGMLEVINDKNKDLRVRVRRPLQDLLAKSGNVDWVYLTRIDSDDMFLEDVVKLIHEQEPFRGALTFQEGGYVYDKTSGKLAEWNPPTNPPFHTIIFPASEFFDADAYVKYYKDFKSHEDIPRIFDARSFRDRHYCVLVHSLKNQISTIWNHPFRGKELSDKSLLSRFGICNS